MLRSILQKWQILKAVSNNACTAHSDVRVVAQVTRDNSNIGLGVNRPFIVGVGIISLLVTDERLLMSGATTS